MYAKHPGGKSPTFSEPPLSAVALFLPPWLTCLWEKLREGKSRIDLRPLRCHREEGEEEEEEERFFFVSFFSHGLSFAE